MHQLNSTKQLKAHVDLALLLKNSDVLRPEINAKIYKFTNRCYEGNCKNTTTKINGDNQSEKENKQINRKLKIKEKEEEIINAQKETSNSANLSIEQVLQRTFCEIANLNLEVSKQ